MDKYECHITVPAANAELCKGICEVLHWKWSAIDGDPVLGKQVFGYLTTHDTDLSRMHSRMTTAAKMLREQGVPVIREKIEHILYDVRH